MVGISQGGRECRRYLFDLKLWRVQINAGFWKRFWCEVRQHPYGVIFDQDQSLSPVLYCENCGQEV